MKPRSLLGILVVVLAVTICLPNIVQAAVFDFESDQYSYEYNEGCLSEKSAKRSYEGNYSGKLSSVVLPEYGLFGVAKIIMPFNAPLGKASVTYHSFIEPGSATYAPYVVFGVDTNQNGYFDIDLTDDGVVNGDALVLAVSAQGNQTDQWFSISLNADTLVHVISNRTGLEEGTYSIEEGGNPGTFGSLWGETFSGSTTWGDLNIVEVRLQAGCWPPEDPDNYTAYVDNLSVVHTPVPGAVWLLGTGLVGLGLLRFRRKKI